MLRQLKNFLFSVQTYKDLSPDVKTRRHVNQALRRRPALTLDQWFRCFWQPQGINKPVVAFVYTQLEKYSGLEIARVLPSDRLDRDLQLTLVCWFDWHMSLCEDFESRFGVDISDRFDFQAISTVEEFVIFLHHQALAVSPS